MDAEFRKLVLALMQLSVTERCTIVTSVGSSLCRTYDAAVHESEASTRDGVPLLTVTAVGEKATAILRSRVRGMVDAMGGDMQTITIGEGSDHG